MRRYCPAPGLASGLAAVLWLLAAVTAHAQWRSLATDAFVVFYPAAEDTLAREVLATLEAERLRVEALTGSTFVRFPVVIEDLGVYTNGLADPVLRRIELFAYEPDAAGQLGYAESWVRALVVHEMTHIGQLSAAHGLPGVMRALFGPSLSTGLLSPGWLAEGLAVYVESSSSPYEGRLNDGFFDALIGVQAREGTLPSLARATFSEEAYPFGTASYLYGAAFLRYLVSRGGEPALASFLAGYAGSGLSYLSPLLPLVGLDRMAKRTWGARLPRLWDEWREWEASRAPAAPAERLLGSSGALEISGVAHDGQDVYYARVDELKTGGESFHAVSRIVRVAKTGEERSVVATPTSFTGSLVTRDGLLYYAVLEVEAGHANVAASGWGTTSVLRIRDLQTGRDREVVRAPLRCFAVLPDGGLLYAEDAEGPRGSVIWELGPGESRPRRVRELPIRIFEMVADDTSLVLCARAERGNTDLYRMGVARWESAEPEPLLRTEWSEATVSLHEGRLAYSSNAGGVHAAWGMDLATGASWRYEAGPYAVWPREDEKAGTLTYVGLTAAGPRLMTAAASRVDTPLDARVPLPEAASPASGLPAPVPSGVRERGYWPNLLTLVPRIRLPILVTDGNSFQAGLWLMGQSALGDLAYDLRAVYDLDSRVVNVVGELGFFPGAPVDLVVDYASADAHALGATVSVTLLRGFQSGLSSAGATLSANVEDTFSRLVPEPGLWLRFHGPWSSVAIRASATIERLELGCASNGTSLLGTIGMQAVLGGGELEWSVQASWDSTGTGGEISAIRGHASSPAGSPAARASLSYEHVLVRIRNGLWNPALYLGDVVAGVFAQGALGLQDAHLAVGIEASAELRMLALSTGLPFMLQGWVGVDENLEPIYGFGGTLEVPLWSGSGGRRGLVRPGADVLHFR